MAPLGPGMCLAEVEMIEKAQSSRSLTECLIHGPGVFSCRGVQLYSGPDWLKFHHLGLEQACSGK